MLFLMAGSVDSHSAAAPPPGSHPRISTSPSQVNAAECHRPPTPTLFPNASCSSTLYRNSGSSRVPPWGAPMLNTLAAWPLAQASRLTSPRITPASWHPLLLPRVPPMIGSSPSRFAPARLSRGTSMMSMAFPSATPSLVHPLDTLLYTMTLPLPRSGTRVTVCEPHGSSTDASRLGFTGSVISKTCTPSHPAGTVCPRQVRSVVFGLFHERTRTLSHTTMSPWSPLQLGWASSVGVSASVMSMTRHP